eukprot:3160038-Amphidinium_carterae.1
MKSRLLGLKCWGIPARTGFHLLVLEAARVAKAQKRKKWREEEYAKELEVVQAEVCPSQYSS